MDNIKHLDQIPESAEYSNIEQLLQQFLDRTSRIYFYGYTEDAALRVFSTISTTLIRPTKFLIYEAFFNQLELVDIPSHEVDYPHPVSCHDYKTDLNIAPIGPTNGCNLVAFHADAMTPQHRIESGLNTTDNRVIVFHPLGDAPELRKPVYYAIESQEMEDDAIQEIRDTLNSDIKSLHEAGFKVDQKIGFDPDMLVDAKVDIAEEKDTQNHDEHKLTPQQQAQENQAIDDAMRLGMEAIQAQFTENIIIDMERLQGELQSMRHGLEGLEIAANNDELEGRHVSGIMSLMGKAMQGLENDVSDMIDNHAG